MSDVLPDGVSLNPVDTPMVERPTADRAKPVRLCLWATIAAALVVNGCGAGAPADSIPVPDAVAAPATEDVALAQVVGRASEGDAIVRAIVLLVPHDDIDVPLPDELVVMDQIGRQFVPGFIIVRAGQTINFTNSEDDLHTVHVKDSAGDSIFNVASMNGSSYMHTFEVGDDFTVVCNTHTEMFADIMVVETPYSAVAERGRAFVVKGVVPGVYTATVIQGQGRRERVVEIVAGRNELDLTDM